MIGLSRDLRGIAFAFNTKVSYMMLFDWIYPQYTPILQRAVEIWYNDPQVCNIPYVRHWRAYRVTHDVGKEVGLK